MSDHRTPPPLSARLNAALSRYRTPLIIVMTLVVVAVIGSVVAYQIVQNRTERAAREAELLEEEFAEWLEAFETRRDAQQADTDDEAEADVTTDAGDESDEAGEETPAADEIATLESGVRERIDAILDQFPRSYGAQRSLFLQGRLEWELENHDAAIDAWTTLADRFPDSHAVATALANAASAAEAAGRAEEAIEYWQRIADGEGSPHLEGPRALFNLGRLAERDGRSDDALSFYRRLESDHPGTNWTRLGRTRIIRLGIEEDAAEE